MVPGSGRAARHCLRKAAAAAGGADSRGGRGLARQRLPRRLRDFARCCTGGSAPSIWSSRRTARKARSATFNRIVGEANADRLELDFAVFFDSAPDVQAFGKNYLAIGFKLDYVKVDPQAQGRGG